MIFPLEYLKSLIPRSKLVVAQVAPTTQDFANKLKTSWNRAEVDIGNDLRLKWRAIARLAATGDYTLKFTYITDHQEVEDLEFVLFVSYDQDMGSLYARKIRAVSKSKEYKNTAPDEREIICFEPDEIINALKHKFHDRNDPLNILARRLYQQAMVHIGERHPELNRTIEAPEPFDYAQEMLRFLKSATDITIGNDEIKLDPLTVTRLKEGGDVVLKFAATAEDLPKETFFNLYLTPDELFGSIGIRKIRVINKKVGDYSDSDEDHPLTLDANPSHAARELHEQLTQGALGDVAFDMFLRARHHLAGQDGDDEV